MTNEYEAIKGHTAGIYDRGGRQKLVDLGTLTRVKYERKRDDISNGSAFCHRVDDSVSKVLGMMESGRHELVIHRGDERAWEGPITRVSYQGNAVNVAAKDVMYYSHRTAMQFEYDNTYPNMALVLDRVKRIMMAEGSRNEALDPPANVLAHMQFLYALPGEASDARTTSHTLPYESTIFEHIDEFAARSGIDYTVVGRAILFFDVHKEIGRGPAITENDFIGAQPIITQYGSELATRVIFTDGKGNYGIAGGTDAYYGNWDVVHQAYDENAQGADPNDLPTVAEMVSQAQRALPQGIRPPYVVRIPDNSRLDPNSPLLENGLSMLVPGIWLPMTAVLPGRRISQMQKLDSISVEESAETGGEVIQMTLSPAKSDNPITEEM